MADGRDVVTVRTYDLMAVFVGRMGEELRFDGCLGLEPRVAALPEGLDGEGTLAEGLYDSACGSCHILVYPTLA